MKGDAPKMKGCPPQGVHHPKTSQLSHDGSSSRHALSPRSKHTDHAAQLIGFEVLFCSVEHGTSGNNSSLKTSKEEA